VVAGTDVDYARTLPTSANAWFRNTEICPEPVNDSGIGWQYESARVITRISGCPSTTPARSPLCPCRIALTAPWARTDTSFTESVREDRSSLHDNWRLRSSCHAPEQDIPFCEFTRGISFRADTFRPQGGCRALSARIDPLTNQPVAARSDAERILRVAGTKARSHDW